MDEMTDYVEQTTNGIQTLTDGVTESTEKINSIGGSGTASFARKEAKKVAKYIETFSAKLREYNTKYTDLLAQIEKDLSGILENKYASKNIEELTSFIKALKLTQNNISESSKFVVGMKSSSLGNLGVERTLNQSIRFLDEDLANYISIMEQISCSIDRVLEKSRFVLIGYHIVILFIFLPIRLNKNKKSCLFKARDNLPDIV